MSKQQQHSQHHDPCIYVIDIDGTLVGDVSYEVCEWEIISRLDVRKLKAFRAKLIEHLRSGLMRPFISDFISMIKQNNEHTEFFLYTASDDKWAQFLVPCIEAACGYKFARPIFTRKHCLPLDKCLKKSLVKISTQVYSRLKPKYGAAVFKDSKHLSDHMILIDNNSVLVDKETKKGIICPTYEYHIVYDVLRSLDERVVFEHAYGIAQILDKYSLIDINAVNPNKAYSVIAAYYADYANRLREYSKKVDKNAKRDRFWLSLGNAINVLATRRISKEAMIRYLNGKLASRSGVVGAK